MIGGARNRDGPGVVSRERAWTLEERRGVWDSELVRGWDEGESGWSGIDSILDGEYLSESKLHRRLSSILRLTV